MASMASTFVALVKEIAMTLAPTVFTSKTVKQSISRSAVLLCVFVVVHVAGNLTVIGGGNTFNRYAEMLHRYKAFLAVEAYLLLNVAAHAVAGVYKSFTNKFNHKLTAAGTGKTMGLDGGTFSLERAQLIVSGSILAAFLVIHVGQFRLGDKTVIATKAGEMEDVYALVTATLAKKPMAIAYCVATLALGSHLWKGWTSAVNTLFPKPSPHTNNAIFIGRVLTVAVCTGFIASVAMMHTKVGSFLPIEYTTYPEAIAAAGLVAVLTLSIPIVVMVEAMTVRTKAS